MQVPLISVGILSGKEIEFSFPVKFNSSVGTEISGTQKVIYQNGKIHWQGKEYNELSFTPQQGAPAFFELKDVTIGINFHWERKEVQKFKGELKIIVEGQQPSPRSQCHTAADQGDPHRPAVTHPPSHPTPWP